MTDQTTPLEERSDAWLRRRRRALLGKLPSLDAILRGSLIERYKRCGKPNCKCAKGPGHGPSYYLSVSRPGGARPQLDYVPKDRQEDVAEYIENHRIVREILEEICDLNRELLRRRKRW